MSITLESRIQYLVGVGPKIAEKLNKLGIFCVQDLLFYYPRDYQDFTSLTKIGEIKISNPEKITIGGKISEIVNKRTSKRRFIVTEAIVEDESGSIKVVWFNQPFLLKMLRPGRELILNGKVGYNWFSKEAVMESPERATKPCIVPVYPETAGITSRYILKLISHISYLIDQVEEWLPEPIVKNLMPIGMAIHELHFPTSMANVEKAQRRIAFDELFLISLRANLSKEEIKKEKAPALDIDDETITEFVAKLPFELTADQKKATWQIVRDMKNPIPMNRLLNGDVGSGKTIVAAIAALVTIKAGYRVAIMCPTEILAKQHYESFKKLFSNKDVGLFTSSSKKYDFQTKIFIGTHALIQESIKLDKLGLVIVDEQHRFGVEQRSKLSKIRSGELKPHFLSMTATPIPRTLHLALFGDLDISIIREKPVDRKEIKTRFVSAQNREKAYQFIRAQIANGRQAFVICPLIEINEEQSDKLFEDERRSVKVEFDKLKAIFPEFKIDMLHGKMKSTEKDAVMADFVSNKTNILVSTSVVEVGVDIPNASVMVIEDAERFGLAQIHQFRGRVGRAEHQSYCFLFSSTMREKALKRLTSLEMTSDGFRLAEMDLETRGPGAVFGTEQSGLLDLKMATLADRELIEEASEAAKRLIESDPDLKNHPLLKARVSEYLQNKHLE